MSEDANFRDLEQVLRTIPIGLTVRSGDGTLFYATEAGIDATVLRPISFEDSHSDGRTIRTMSDGPTRGRIT